MNFKLFFLIIFSFNTAYSNIDSLFLNKIKHFSLNDIESLVDEIKNVKNERDQYVYISLWISDKLSYNSSAVGKKLKYTLETGDAVCRQYAMLTKLICKKVGIKCYDVPGVVKLSGESVIVEEHLWNIVEINGVSFVSDITWCDKGSYFDSTYMLLNPFVASLTHRSFKKKYNINSVSEDFFIYGPFFYSNFIKIINTSISYNLDNNFYLSFKDNRLKLNMYCGNIVKYISLGFSDLETKHEGYEAERIDYNLDANILDINFQLKSYMVDKEFLILSIKSDRNKERYKTPWFQFNGKNSFSLTVVNNLVESEVY